MLYERNGWAYERRQMLYERNGWVYERGSCQLKMPAANFCGCRRYYFIRSFKCGSGFDGFLPTFVQFFSLTVFHLRIEWTV